MKCAMASQTVLSSLADRLARGDSLVSAWCGLQDPAIAGLLAIALNRAFHNAGWAWVKLATGILMFEYGFVGVQGPMQREAERSAQALAGRVDPATLAESLGAERGTLWVLLAIATANVVLGIWRPRILIRVR